MPCCWWLLVVLLALVQHGESHENITENPVSSTEKPGLVRRFIGTINDYVFGRKPQVPPTNNTRSPRNNGTSTPEAEQVIHKLNNTPALPSTRDKKPQPELQGSNRDPKCLPVNVTVSTTTDNSNALGDQAINILAEIENMTINLFPGNVTGLRNQINDSFASNVTSPRVGKGLLHGTEYSTEKDSNRGAKCIGFPKDSNVSATTDNGNVLLDRVFKLFSEIENSTFNATSTNVAGSRNRTQGLFNQTLGSENDSLLRVGKRLVMEHVNGSAARHNSTVKASCLKGHNKTTTHKASNETDNITETVPRALFHKFFGLGGNKHSKNSTYRIARYIKHLSKTGTPRNHYFNQYLDKMKANNWTYIKTAIYIINVNCKRNCSRAGRDLDYYDEYLYDDYYWDDLFGRSAGAEEEWEDLFSSNSSEDDWTAWGQNASNIDRAFFKTKNDTIEILLVDSETNFLDRESRQIEIPPENATDRNSSLGRPFHVDNEPTTVLKSSDGNTSIPKSGADFVRNVSSAKTNTADFASNTSSSETNGTSSIWITPKSDAKMLLPVNTSESHNLTSVNMTPKWSGVLIILNETNDNPLVPRWNNKLNDSFDGTAKWVDLFSLNATEDNVSSHNPNVGSGNNTLVPRWNKLNDSFNRTEKRDDLFQTRFNATLKNLTSQHTPVVDNGNNTLIPRWNQINGTAEWDHLLQPGFNTTAGNVTSLHNPNVVEGNNTVPGWNNKLNDTFNGTAKWEDLFRYNTTEANVTSRHNPSVISNLSGNDSIGSDENNPLVKISLSIDLIAQAEIEISERNSNLTVNDTWRENDTNLSAHIPLPIGGNGTEHRFDHQMVFTIVLDGDNSTDNSTIRRNVTQEGLHFIFNFLNNSYARNGTGDRYSYNTSGGSPYIPGGTNYFHVQNHADTSQPHIPPHPSEEENFIEQPPLVWREPNQMLKIYIPPPLVHHFHNPGMPHHPFPNLRLVCPPTATPMCPLWLPGSMRKCFVPMDCPRPSQLCCQVGCGIECVDGILVPVHPHFY